MNRSEPGQNRKVAALRMSRTSHESSPTSFFRVLVPFIIMRAEPRESSQIISQAIYAEKISVIEIQGDWFCIQTEDGYCGWVCVDPIMPFTEHRAYTTPVACVMRCAVHVYHVQDTIFGPIVTLPLLSCLEVLDIPQKQDRWCAVRLLDGRSGFVQTGDIELCPMSDLDLRLRLRTKQEMVDFALQLPSLPYTWGGRSSIFGFDCSGLVQILYRLMGVLLPRDSKDQCQWTGFRPVCLEELEAGDLVFFGPQENHIIHVGMFLGNNEFLHTSPREQKPWIRKSNLCDAEWDSKSELMTQFRCGRALCM